MRRRRCSNPSCRAHSPRGGFGRRKDGRELTRCPRCRSAQASRAGTVGNRKANTAPADRDARALRVVERYAGFPLRDWRTPAARAWEHRTGHSLQRLWTHRMRTLAAREG